MKKLLVFIIAAVMLIGMSACKAKVEYTVTEGESGADFVIEFPEGKDIKILQITDTQIQNYGVGRNENRIAQTTGAFFTNAPTDHQTRVWQYMDEAVEKAGADLIVLTGDNIYGEMDDDGKTWTQLIKRLDSYKTPWLLVFGNHDNESNKGVMWQIEQIQNSKYGIFKQGSVTGNCNYNVLVKQGGMAKYLFYMLDTNGCRVIESNPGEAMDPNNIDIDKICQTQGIFPDQLDWIKESSQSVFETYGKVPVMTFMHIPPKESAQAVLEKYPSVYSSVTFRPDMEGDTGKSSEKYGGFSGEGFWSLCKEIGCKGMFVGHQHKIATSIICDGIRVTYGLKTGTYDYHSSSMLGSVAVSIDEDTNEFTVEYLPTELEYYK